MTDTTTDTPAPARVAKLAALLDEFVDNTFLPELEGASKGEINKLLVFYKQMKDAHDALDKARKRISTKLQSVAYNTIPERMEAADMKTVTIEHDLKFRATISHRMSCSMLDKEQAFQWLRDNDLGAIISETVNAGTMGATAKAFMADTGRELPEDIFKISVTPNTSITKA